MPFRPFFPQRIPAIQGILLMTGLYFGIHGGFIALELLVNIRTAGINAIISLSVFVWATVNILFKLCLD
jgi:hypothetical protein